MAENHPFTIKLEQDPQSERRFRWNIYEGEKLRERSPQSYATIRRAKADAERFTQIHNLAERQMTKHPKRPRPKQMRSNL